MSFERCKICDAYGWSDTHKCPPKWECKVEDYCDGWGEIYAVGAEQAAERYAERWDRDGEYSIIRNGSAMIIVRRDGVETRVHIKAESAPTYTGYVQP